MFNRPATVALLLAFASHIVAADKPYAPAAPAAFKFPADGISPKQLGEMLTNLGYETKISDAQDGNPVHTFTATPEGWNVIMEVVLSNDGSVLWFSALLNQKSRMEALDSDYFRNLLARNFTIHPYSYNICTHGRLYLNLPVTNKNITAVTLRRHIEALVASTVNLKADWHPTMYQEAKKAGQEGEKQAAK